MSGRHHSLCARAGEAPEHHQELVDFVTSFKFERCGVFAFSEEEGTPAATFPAMVPTEIREARRDQLISLQQGVSEGFAAALVGRTLDVLVDGYNDDGWLIGRTQVRR